MQCRSFLCQSQEQKKNKKIKGYHNYIPSFKLNSVFYKATDPANELSADRKRQAYAALHGKASQELEITAGRQGSSSTTKAHHYRVCMQEEQRIGGSDQGQPTGL